MTINLNIKIKSVPSYRKLIEFVNNLSMLTSNILISKNINNRENRFVTGKSLLGITSLDISKQDKLDIIVINNNENQLHKDVEYIKALFSKL